MRPSHGAKRAKILDETQPGGFDGRVRPPLRLAAACACLAACQTLAAIAGEPAQVLPLWPGTAPGDQAPPGQEHDTTKPTDGLIAGKSVIRLGEVYQPTIAVYPAAGSRKSGAAVLVCPGGGYHILAMDLEGTEVCEWLNSLGVTAVLLKYRVPERPGVAKHAAALQDAERALGLVRHRAADWGIDPKRIGVLGFSAGGHLAAVLSTQSQERSYSAIDSADQVSCRPDFTILVYPAYLTVKEENDRIAPEVTITSNTPPAFICMAEDDPVRVENALGYALALRKANVPLELHIYPTGGHGYGLRPTAEAVTSWPQRAAEWLRSRGWLEPK